MSLAVSTTTNASYSSGWNTWVHYCTAYGIQSPLQPDEDTLIGFVAWCTSGGRKSKPLAFSTIKSYLHSIKYVHRRALLPDPVTGARALEMAVKGAKRFLAKERPKKTAKLPVTVSLLEGIRQYFNFDVHDDRVRWAVLVCGVFGLLRLGELLPKDKSNVLTEANVVRVSDDHVQLVLPASKTDPFRQGVTINYFRTGGVVCPVEALTRLLKHRPERLSRSGPLFTMSDGSVLKRDVFTTMLQSHIDRLENVWRIGLNSEQFSGHSLRRGGVSDALIQVLGRWQSDAYKRYILQPLVSIRDAMRVMARCNANDKEREKGVMTQVKAPFEPMFHDDA